MKKYILLLFVFINLCSFAQFVPTQYKFDFFGENQYLSADSSYFKQDKFILGYQWGCSKKITQATFCNQTDAHRNHLDTLTFNNNTYITVPAYGTTHGLGEGVLNARGIEYSPILKIDSVDYGKFVKVNGENDRRAFGYKHIRGRVESFNNDQYNYGLVIDGDSLENEVILSEPWPCNQLTQFGFGKDEDINRSHHCYELIFSINLRRLDNDTGQSDLDRNILKIELPYSYLYDSVYYLLPDSITKHHQSVLRYSKIQFSQIPSTLPYPYSTSLFINNRGLSHDKSPADPNIREFYITRNMLPPASADSNITITASFICDGKLARNNYNLKVGSPNVWEIDSLKIKITYLGGCDIVINNTSLTTPHAQHYFLGGYDSVLVDSVKGDLSKFEAMNNNNIKLFRYVTIVEGGLQHWWAEKYFNKLIGNLSCSETIPICPEHYEYYTNAPSSWFGMLLSLIKYL